ncbi:MAG TPA: hypothetical protein VK578_01825 [Edaphobacter sp.]|nr:hypothetical protein [Edaphobacter sp.]
MARSTFGVAVYRDPGHFAGETLEYYVMSLVSSPLRRAQYEAFHVALESNPLAGIEASLKRSTVPMGVVWGSSDDIFSQADANYLDATFPQPVVFAACRRENYSSPKSSLRYRKGGAAPVE